MKQNKDNKKQSGYTWIQREGRGVTDWWNEETKPPTGWPSKKRIINISSGWNLTRFETPREWINKTWYLINPWGRDPLDRIYVEYVGSRWSSAQIYFGDPPQRRICLGRWIQWAALDNINYYYHKEISDPKWYHIYPNIIHYQ